MFKIPNHKPSEPFEKYRYKCRSYYGRLEHYSFSINSHNSDFRINGAKIGFASGRLFSFQCMCPPVIPTIKEVWTEHPCE